MRSYEIRSGGGSEMIEAEHLEDACEQAREWLKDGSWDRSQTIWLDARVQEMAADGTHTGPVETVTVTLDPEEPACIDDDGHDWQAPHEIVGGCKENPGVWGHGGGVVINEVCMLCGCGRTTDTWAQRPDTGEQGLTSVSYEPDQYEEELTALE